MVFVYNDFNAVGRSFSVKPDEIIQSADQILCLRVLMSCN